MMENSIDEKRRFHNSGAAGPEPDLEGHTANFIPWRREVSSVEKFIRKFVP